MVEDIGLHRLVIGPDLVLAEDIDLDRQPELARLQVTHQKGHLEVHHRVFAQVGFDVGAEGPHIGQATAVGQAGVVDLARAVEARDFLFFSFELLMCFLLFSFEPLT